MINLPHNPLLPNHIFVPDCEAHVWADGRIYLYGSLDIMGNRSFCSDVHHVYSSDDLLHWVDHGVAFSLADSTWAKDCGVLYAPDCCYRDGWYYLYYCVPDGRCGVTKSQSPTGPFEDVGQLEGVWGIDPSVFVDDDGQAYIYWGQITWCKAAKLKDNMVEIIPESITQPLTVEEHEFHEGSSVKRIGDKYYYLFADTHRHGDPNREDGRPSSLGYAVSDHPLHGFKYGGIIIDNFGCDPKVWNNHGSMECFKGQWYVFYHRSTHGSEFSRHVCAEPIFFEADGSIREVKQTTSGVGGPIPATECLPASYACELSGSVCIAADTDSDHTLALTSMGNGDTATFRYVAFDGESSVTVRIRTTAKARLELYADRAYMGEMKLRPTDGYETFTAPIQRVYGNRELTLKLYGGEGNVAVDEMVFR